MAEDLSPAPPRPATPRARDLLTRRLADIVCLPSSQIAPQERWMVADVLDELLRAADVGLRAKVSKRLAQQNEAPRALVRRLAHDDFEVAEPLLRRSQALSDFDMMDIAQGSSALHRLELARRESVSETVAAALAAGGDMDVITSLLRNDGARLASQTVEVIVRVAAEHDAIARLLIRRPELRPAQALALFWSVSHDMRRMILDRFAASRQILQDAAEDVFPLAAREAEPDTAVQEALAYIDRRQRDRKAAEVTPYGSLEGLIERASQIGFTEELRAEAAVLANIQRDLLNRMIDDFGGEPLAILAKATGLSRQHLSGLIEGSGRTDAFNRVQQAILVFDTMSVDKAQTVLRYWNWVIARSARGD
ncbi:MAG: hypothetical protein CMH90_01610 [Oceanicaulis sp.]|uniref:DUF2336 domain-containing protein n=1 Tax=Oceanicaulis sp. UBA2681 TaxID=1947007 RepID=UPI000C0A8280|nr:DUF2336 domain-containing protein [Oceanicaulis sp. UBA2681]MAP48154.1 hypothetical protein [Oceanicaulis sp.]